MFALDRHLLALEPHLFRDAAWAGQRLVGGVGDVAGGTLTLLTSDVDFTQAGIAEGHIALIGETPYEVLERTGDTTLTISRLRPSTIAPPILPSPATGKAITIVSFAPQIAIIHGHILRLLGLATDGLGEEAVTNPADLALFEALGALHLIYTAAAALAQRDSGLRARAEYYEERFARERQAAAARIDLDGDGMADAIRRPSLLHLFRA